FIYLRLVDEIDEESTWGYYFINYVFCILFKREVGKFIKIWYDIFNGGYSYNKDQEFTYGFYE
ncbi:hypothetical protein ACNR90_000030, partial [Candidozyma auris]